MNIKILFLFPLIALCWSGFASAQVTIPANSANSLDSGTTGSVSTLPPVYSSAFSNSSSISRAQQLTTPISGQKATITSTRQPVMDQKLIASKVIAIQRVEAKAQPLSVVTIKRLSELRRELNIAESASRARIVLPADQLFEESDPAEINRFSVPVLLKVSEYLLLSDKKRITVTSYYAPDQENGKSLAWGRSLSLIEWMEDSGGLPAVNINSSRPAPVETKTQMKFPNTPGERAFQNRIELNLE